MLGTLKYLKRSGNRIWAPLRYHATLNVVLYLFSGCLLLILIIQSFLTPEPLNDRDLIIRYTNNILAQEALQELHADMTCSHFTRHVFIQAGIALPATAQEQYYSTQGKTMNMPVKGSLVFFSPTTAKESVSHVGIYLRNDTFVHTPGIGQKATYANIKDTYWHKRLVGFKDYLPEN